MFQSLLSVYVIFTTLFFFQVSTLASSTNCEGESGQGYYLSSSYDKPEGESYGGLKNATMTTESDYLQRFKKVTPSDNHGFILDMEDGKTYIAESSYQVYECVSVSELPAWVYYFNYDYKNYPDIYTRLASYQNSKRAIQKVFIPYREEKEDLTFLDVLKYRPIFKFEDGSFLSSHSLYYEAETYRHILRNIKNRSMLPRSLKTGVPVVRTSDERTLIDRAGQLVFDEIEHFLINLRSLEGALVYKTAGFSWSFENVRQVLDSSDDIYLISDSRRYREIEVEIGTKFYKNCEEHTLSGFAEFTHKVDRSRDTKEYLVGFDEDGQILIEAVLHNNSYSVPYQKNLLPTELPKSCEEKEEGATDE